MSDDTDPPDPDVPPMPEAVKELPPAAKVVYLALLYHGPLSRAEVARCTALNPAALHRQFAQLEHAGVLEREPIDAHRKRYDVVE